MMVTLIEGEGEVGGGRGGRESEGGGIGFCIVLSYNGDLFQRSRSFKLVSKSRLT